MSTVVGNTHDSLRRRSTHLPTVFNGWMHTTPTSDEWVPVPDGEYRLAMQYVTPSILREPLNVDKALGVGYTTPKFVTERENGVVE